MSANGSCIVVGANPARKYKGIIERYDIGECIGEEYAAFYGIPYARIPGRGLKRFQAPIPLDSRLSRRTYEAKETKKICSQLLTVSQLKTVSKKKDRFICRCMGSTDCLYLNIFLPKNPELIDELLPVLVYIHGGGFAFGSNYHKILTPDSIVQQGLILVTITYRLGVLGFLNMRKKECPGNAGLKDQVKALEWIRDNISCFKGDPNNVTLSGQSAGATCVNLHLISPASNNLFHKAIVQSGGVYTTWGYRGHCFKRMKALDSDEFWKLASSKKESYELQKYAHRTLGRDRGGIMDHLDFYAQNKQNGKLALVTPITLKWVLMSILHKSLPYFLSQFYIPKTCFKKKRHPQTISPTFGPSVEKFREGAFLPDNLEEMMEEVTHNKPIMAGITKAEGITLYISNDTMKFTELINHDENFRQFLKDNLRWSDETARMLINVIRDEYFPDRLTSTKEAKRIQFANFARDVIFRRFYDNFRFGPQRTVHENLHVYRFDHFSQLCGANGLDDEPHFVEPTHGDCLKYLYCPILDKYRFPELINQNTEVQQVMNHICSLWANFCRTGVPKSDYATTNIDWRCHTEGNPCFLSISNNLELKGERLFEKEWDWLNERVNAQPTVESQAATPEPAQQQS